MIGPVETPCTTHVNLCSPLSLNEQSIMAELERSNRQSEVDLLNNLGIFQGDLREALESLRKRGLVYKQPAEWSEDGVIQYSLGREMSAQRNYSLASYRHIQETVQFGGCYHPGTLRQSVMHVAWAFHDGYHQLDICDAFGRWLSITEFSWASGYPEEDVEAGVKSLMEDGRLREQTFEEEKRYAINLEQGDWAMPDWAVPDRAVQK